MTVVRSQGIGRVEWQLAEVESPQLAGPVPVVAAKGIPYVPNANRLQNLSIYLPKTPETSNLIGTPAEAMPNPGSRSGTPRTYVHIHGGAWRDPQLTSTSIEPTVAHVFSADDTSAPITSIVSINYTVSRFPTHPTLPYDPIKDNHSDLAREAVHPQHVSDVLHGFALLRSYGLTDGSYVLSGHSCGACIEDQLVPMNQKERFEAHLNEVGGLRVFEGHRCTGKHAAPWEQGVMMWRSLQDVLRLLQQEK